MTDPTDPLEAALSAAWLELEREHGHSSAWPDDTWPSCATVHAVLRQARFALATPRPAGVDVEWFVEEVVAYYKLYDHHDIWRESGARALGEWLDARAALTGSEEPARE